MKKTINLLVLLLLCIVTTSAQKYDVKCLRGDSVAVYDLIETIHTDNTFYKKGEKVMFYLHNGEQVEGVDKFYDGGGIATTAIERTAAFRVAKKLSTMTPRNKNAIIR